jgi:hypothetical protein
MPDSYFSRDHDSDRLGTRPMQRRRNPDKSASPDTRCRTARSDVKTRKGTRLRGVKDEIDNGIFRVRDSVRTRIAVRQLAVHCDGARGGSTSISYIARYLHNFARRRTSWTSSNATIESKPGSSIDCNGIY